jgi:hypothetical protein
VIPGEGLLKVTLVYNDPPGTTSASMHRINDLDLTVTSPSSVVYHGNNGLLAETLSAPGGVADTLNTVENVFVRAPGDGHLGRGPSRPAEVNQDSHVETGTVDVDYALVVSGAEILPTEPPAAPSNLRAGAGVITRPWRSTTTRTTSPASSSSARTTVSASRRSSRWA